MLVLEKIDARFKSHQALKKHATIVECVKPKESQLVPFVNAEAKRRALTLERGADEMLCAVIGADLLGLFQAIDKLAMYAAPRTQILIEDVEACVAPTRLAGVFDLVGAVAAKERERALGLVAQMLRAREAPVYAVAMLARQIRLLRRAKAMEAQGKKRFEITAQLSLWPKLAEEVFRQLSGFSLPELDDAVVFLAGADQALKSSRVDGDLILEKLVFDLTQTSLRNAGPPQPAR